MTVPLDDFARFEAGDEPALVEASFCCGVCLRKPSAVIVGVDEAGGRAWCFCSVCEQHTEVTLNANQILRLAVAPPRDGRIHLIPVEEL